MLDLFATDSSAARPIWLVHSGDAEAWLKNQPDYFVKWARTSRFSGEDGRILLIPDHSGEILGVALGLGRKDDTDPFAIGALFSKLPPGNYQVQSSDIDPNLIALGWALGAYRFDTYKSSPNSDDHPRLVLPDGADADEVNRIAEAVYLVRDLVNTPANDMGPEDIEAAARKLCEQHGGHMQVICGDDLLTENFPMVHAVGRASSRAPRLIDITWGDAAAPKVTLVGKGVCFDSGGLNLKPGNAMELMKKDMGGGAHVLGLAHAIMSAETKVRLRVLVPAVENAVSANAFRPGDVLQSRKGLTVEIGNTDAEGRLILGDALSLADEEKPDLLICMATLTGAARIALGPELAAFFTPDDALASELNDMSQRTHDPVWRLPLWPGYRNWLKSKVADINHMASNQMAGSTTAALFLSRFISETPNWIHFDIYAWNPKGRPGRPIGGEAQAIRALYELIKTRFAEH